jgi:hypothetical protein
MNVLKRGWIPLLIVVVVAIAASPSTACMERSARTTRSPERAPALSGIFIKRAGIGGPKLLHCNLYREDIRVFRGFGQGSASRPGPP